MRFWHQHSDSWLLVGTAVLFSIILVQGLAPRIQPNTRHQKHKHCQHKASTSEHAYDDSSLNVRRTVWLPLWSTLNDSTMTSSSTSNNKAILTAFDSIVEFYSKFLVEDLEIRSSTETSCNIPSFGETARISFSAPSPSSSSKGGVSKTVGSSTTHESSSADDGAFFKLHIDGVTEGDFQWLCHKFWQARNEGDLNDYLDVSELRRIVADAQNLTVAPIGFDAALASWADSTHIQDLFKIHNPQALDELERLGYTVVDTPWMTSPESHALMSQFLTEKTNQSDAVRRDKVHFLSEANASSCGLTNHYNLLMAVPHYLNSYYKGFRTSVHRVLAPGTRDRPLSIPQEIQLAEYGENDFYVVHSDNSLCSDGATRNNYRHITCILYMNDDWDSDRDGGVLRLYPRTRDVPKASLYDREYEDDGVTMKPAASTYVDVAPINGKMLLFDSCLLHSVETVTARHKLRRALTLWIYRPEDSGAQGERIY